MKLRLRIPIVSGIPDSLKCTSDSKAFGFGFHKQNSPNSLFLRQKFPGFGNPDSLAWGDSWFWRYKNLAKNLWLVGFEVDSVHSRLFFRYLSDYKLLVIGQIKSDSFGVTIAKLSYKMGCYEKIRFKYIFVIYTITKSPSNINIHELQKITLLSTAHLL